jgi:hypothetical protein
MSAQNTELANHLIEHYRKLIEHRYQYENLQEILDLPIQIDKSDVDAIRGFFLNSVYPPPEQRQELDEAFQNLKSYMLNPAKAIPLLGNVAVASLRFGTKFPAAVKAGMLSLESYLSARRFERRLLQIAEEKFSEPPLTDEQFQECVDALPYKEAEKFTEEIGAFLESLTNIELLEKTIEILGTVTGRMEKRPRLYKPEEVEGIKVGLDILKRGKEVFKGFDTVTRGQIIQLILATEMYYLDLRNASEGEQT